MIDEYIDMPALQGQYKQRQAFVIKLLVLMLESHADVPAKLRQIVEAQDLSALAAEAHRLKGAMVMVHAMPLLLQIGEIESSAKSGDPDVFMAAEQYAVILEQFLECLQAYLGGQSPD
ncbi:MAG: Hpt domain-containing protein [Gallionella sp.]|nr:Hpt domain-containing protein [Gallionella sp.]MDD4947679.1 Hpt domain-containing protein [Gallionella sp.]